ncbi:hypothetical protein H310_06524 [Aphanomyces invadans]|uniref:Uncharacterized protein n=1 Tax=Aphanomyces invadans TaxID=157072 RepID=A0A024U6G7_9STRA|nr:hypothetical protein H310_06524 [Aphanomyces invadans]ETW02006.1 hypothetical protein H310_06524 [Aphanomyces invadans]|eukprot:XP_008869854.1 hypothetical protein H310_06524 [Aphanomyces invadans]
MLLRDDKVKITLTLNPSIASSLLVFICTALTAMLVCLACRCLRKAKTPSIVDYTRGAVRHQRTMAPADQHEYTHPFLGPPDYEQPYDEQGPPAYHELPSAPPLE